MCEFMLFGQTPRENNGQWPGLWCHDGVFLSRGRGGRVRGLLGKERGLRAPGSGLFFWLFFLLKNADHLKFELFFKILFLV